MRKVWYSFLAFILFAVFVTPTQAAWNTAQHDFQRTGYNPASSIDQARLTKVWTYLHPTHGALWSDPVELNGRVFATFGSFSAADDLLEAVDMNTGALLWSAALPSTGAAARGTPTAATVDTTGAGDFADLVYVVSGASGFSAGIRCFRGADGTQKFAASSGAQRIRYSRPALADTNSDGKYDIVVAGTEGGSLYAWDASTGAFAWSASLDLGYWIFFGPSTSADGEVIYCGTWDLLATGHGRVHAIDATTGATLGVFDPVINGAYEDEGYPAAVVYIDDSTVCAAGYGVNGTDGRYTILDRNAGLLGQGSVNNRAVFASGAIYPDPLSTDTLFIVPTEGAFGAFGVGIIARARDIPTMRGGGSGFRYNFFACTDAGFLPESPISVANSPDSYGVAAINTDDPDAKLYIFPAKSATGTTNTGYWNKSYGLSAGFLQRSGTAMVDGLNDSGIVFVTLEGYGSLHGFRNLSTPRARWTDASGCLSAAALNVPLAFGGTTADTITFFNIGDASGSYSVAGESVLVAGRLTKESISKVQVEYSSVSPARQALADDFTDQMTITGKERFFSKRISADRRIFLTDIHPDLLTKTSFANKKRILPTSTGVAAPPSWLTVTDLTGGGPIAAGDSANIELVASSANLGLGTYYAQLHFTVTPDEPDPDFYGGTDVVLPITLIVGFVPEEVVITTPLVEKLVTNYSALANDAGTQNFVYNGVNELFDGGIIIGNGPTTLIMDVAAHVQAGIIPDTSIGVTDLVDSTITYTRYIDNAGLGIRVGQTTKTFADTSRAGFVLYRLEITNIADSLIPSLGVGLYFDWDIDASTYATNLGGMDTAYKVFYQYDNGNPALRFGVMGIPFNSPVYGYELLDNNVYVYPNSDLVDDSVWAIMTRASFSSTGAGGPEDHSMILTLSLADLDSGATRVEEFALFGYDTTQVTTDSLANLINATATSVRNVKSEVANVPKSFELNQNFPNPFNATTQIRFSVPKASHVQLQIFDILGRKVKSLVNENLTAGYKQITWDGKNESGDEVASGVYFYRIKTGDFQTTKKMVLLK